jgi:hypothetical protein
MHLQSKEALSVSPSSINRHKKTQYARKNGYEAMCKKPVSKFWGMIKIKTWVFKGLKTPKGGGFKLPSCQIWSKYT